MTPETGSRPLRAPVPRRTRGLRGAEAFSAGAALARSFGVFGSQVLILVPLAAVFVVVPTWLEMVDRESPSGFWSGTHVAQMLSAWLLTMAFQAMVTYAVFQRLRGTPARYGASFAEGLLRLPAVLGTSLLLGLAVWGPLFLLSYVLATMVLKTGAWGLYLLLMLASLAWALYVLSRWFVAVQVAVVERCGPLTALRRTGELTRGARGRLFGIVMLVYALPLVVEYILRVFIFARAYLHDGDRHTDIYVGAGFDVVFLGLQAVTAACVYHGLRQAKEGVGVDDLLKVFS